MKLIHLVYIKYLSFLFTHPYGCDHLNASASFASFSFQFTHLCEVRQQTIPAIDRDNKISIHAPVQGATIYFFCNLLQKVISIHAPVWVRLTQGFRIRKTDIHFNSRTRMGATQAILHLRIVRNYFNSRTRMGATVTCALIC